ncbi:hypothetical protein NO976_03059 [Planktothrix agardhii]|jgi:predicted DNA-binding antitoxin AbrB/MazE fold protein|uniref:DUF104 domain-containing protein n=1 Tax=Planktothrix agardhii TaxID=1160 RepID=A0A1J1JCN9_PLAAG|nr:antitoxin family protein [Planktothrix agardhii]MCF3575629.1 antitoxin family protein [Planktothrix agardhii 1812]MCF3580548.1 antitoxin family protein [Planktothrix agardhii 1811]MCF3625137.1 antitoxin family protein [Planktothrix agardhii 1801]CAD5957869.1 hypothetical protein NO976_03059 [Planktothrix agardhii]CAD5971385.1 hypothetical protein PCC7805_03832 [Planktothrix agardhii]
MQQSFDAVFENGVFRPLADFQLTEGQTVKLIIESESMKKTKGFPKTGIIAKLTANPLVIPNFHSLTREEANERW